MKNCSGESRITRPPPPPRTGPPDPHGKKKDILRRRYIRPILRTRWTAPRRPSVRARSADTRGPGANRTCHRPLARPGWKVRSQRMTRVTIQACTKQYINRWKASTFFLGGGGEKVLGIVTYIYLLKNRRKRCRRIHTWKISWFFEFFYESFYCFNKFKKK